MRLLRLCWPYLRTGAVLVLGVAYAGVATAQQRREREPNEVYAARRAKIAAQVEGPVILWGLTGREEYSQSYVFAQEDNFYYLTGHNEEGAGLIILPAAKARERSEWDGPREMLFLPAKEPQKEKWNGVGMAQTDADIAARAGFATVQAFGEMRAAIEKLAKAYPGNFYTILPYEKENGGYPHEKAVVDWLQMAVPQVKLKDIRGTIEALRTMKSPG